MGNQQCWQAGNKGEEKNEKVQLVDYHPENLPQLPQPVKKVLIERRPFAEQLRAEPDIVTKQYGEEFYEGPVDLANRPSGYGKLYKKDGSLVISHFTEGKSQGPSIFIFSDGSYYEGNLIDNHAEDQNGQYVNAQFTYEGGFHENAFNGNGKEVGPGYTFQGSYLNGRKVNGVLKWTQGSQQYQYEGSFNQNFQFQDSGTLKEGSIGIYKGTFKDGKKHGTGAYTYLKNDVRYQGEYKKGVKSGAGTIYNHDDTIAYSGNFENDLPNGEGFVIDNGKKTYAQFRDGIDVERLPA